jgi:hypothetical protein
LGDLEILRVFKMRPGQQSDDQAPTLVVDTKGETSGTAVVLFESAARSVKVHVFHAGDS